MRPITRSPTPNSQWEELTQTQPDLAQLEKTEAHLDLVLLALEALAGIGADAMLQAARQLNLESRVPDHMALWQQPSNNLLLGEAGRKKLDVEAARSLVLINCYLAKQHQELIRRAVTLLEQQAANNRNPHDVALLGDYIDAFSRSYQRFFNADNSKDRLTTLALKLLIELLFYSSPSGHRHLWSALLDRSV